MVLQCMTMEAHETVQAPERGEETFSPFRRPEFAGARPCCADPYAVRTAIKCVVRVCFLQGQRSSALS